MSIEKGGAIIANSVHPLFLYESIWNFIGVAFLLFYKKYAQKFKGEIFLVYIAFYGVGRGFLESFRPDEYTLKLGNIPVSQWLAFLSAAAAIAVILWARRQNFKSEQL